MTITTNYNGFNLLEKNINKIKNTKKKTKRNIKKKNKKTKKNKKLY